MIWEIIHSLFGHDELDETFADILNPAKNANRQLLEVCIPVDPPGGAVQREFIQSLINEIHVAIGKSKRKGFHRPTVAEVMNVVFETRLLLFGKDAERIRIRITPTLRKHCPKGTYFRESLYKTRQDAKITTLFEGDKAGGFQSG